MLKKRGRIEIRPRLTIACHMKIFAAKAALWNFGSCSATPLLVRRTSKSVVPRFSRSFPSPRSVRSWTDSNRRRRFCRPVPNHSATRPFRYSNIILFSSVYKISRLLFCTFVLSGTKPSYYPFVYWSICRSWSPCR